MLRAGLVDSAELQAAESARQLISEALEEWKVEQRRTNRTPQHTGKTVQQIERLCSLANWEKLVDMNADSMQIALDDIRAHGGKAPKGEVRRASARTVQAYVRAGKGFTRWCIRNGKLVADPLTNVGAPNPQSDRKHVRRAMTRGEWQALREYLCKETEPRRGVEPEQRAMLYELLILTGYRKEEFRQLRVSSLQTVA